MQTKTLTIRGKKYKNIRYVHIPLISGAVSPYNMDRHTVSYTIQSAVTITTTRQMLLLVLLVFHASGTATMMFFPVSDVKVLRQCIASKCERLKVAGFFFFSVPECKFFVGGGGLQRVFVVFTAIGTSVIPTPLARLDLLLGTPTEKWNRVLVSYN